MERRRGFVPALGQGGEETRVYAGPRSGRDEAWASFPLFIASCTFGTLLFVLRELFRYMFFQKLFYQRLPHRFYYDVFPRKLSEFCLTDDSFVKVIIGHKNLPLEC